MARGGARPGAGRPARKSPNTSPVSARARARAREAAGNQRPWPADKVERWGIERLIPYAKNARTHTDAQVAAIAASIKEWGWTSPALEASSRQISPDIDAPSATGFCGPAAAMKPMIRATYRSVLSRHEPWIGRQHPIQGDQAVGLALWRH